MEGPLRGARRGGEDAGADADHRRTSSSRSALTTRLEFDGLTGDLVADLDALASGRVPVLVLTQVEPEKAEKPEKAGEAREAGAPEPQGARRARRRRQRPRSDRSRGAGGAAGGAAGRDQGRSRCRSSRRPSPEPEFEPVEPVRETRPAARTELIRDSVRMLPDPAADPGAARRRRPGAWWPGSTTSSADEPRPGRRTP